MDYDKELKKYKIVIERYLEGVLPSENTEPRILHEAMRYSVFSGGKRLRPLIVLVTGRMLGVEEKKILPVACGIELIHNFSLIHDDLPAMDNDDFRRGKETCHKKYNEAVAILAGDALLTLGFKLIAETGNIPLIKETADTIGSLGMAGGQALDIMYKERQISQAKKKNLDYLKTGMLFQLCFSVPLFFKKIGGKKKQKLISMSRNFGLAFQIRDDIEDREGNIDMLKKQLSRIYKKLKNDIEYFGEKGKLLLYISEKLYRI